MWRVIIQFYLFLGCCALAAEVPREAVEALDRMHVLGGGECRFEVSTRHVCDRGMLNVSHRANDVEVNVHLRQQRVQLFGDRGQNLPMWRERIVPQHVVTPMDFSVMFRHEERQYLGEQRIRARYAYVWSFEDKTSHCFGKIWIDKHLFAPMRVEWSDDVGHRHKIDILSFKNTQNGWFVKTVEVSDEHDVVSKIRFFQ